MMDSSGSVTVEVDNPADYKEAQEHANALGLTAEKFRWFGSWEDNEGIPVFMSGGENPVEKAGYEYFHAEVSTPDGSEMVKLTSRNGGSMSDDGKLKVTFG